MVIQKAVNIIRRATPASLRKSLDAFRPLPDFLIIGAMKAGTTSLHEHLVRHPKLAFARIKELQYFSRFHHRGESYYRSQFPLVRPVGSLVGEASPSYIFLPTVPKRILKALPHVKMIVLLRDPVERAISQYFHHVRTKKETLPIAEALDAEETRINAEYEMVLANENPELRNLMYFSYKRRGHYLEQLERYWELFPRDRLLVLRSEDFFENPLGALSEICAFLGVSDLPNWGKLQAHNIGGNREEVPDEVRADLRKYFAPHNRRLEEALGRKMGWD